MTQPRKRTRQADGAEGALQTADIMAAVKRLRLVRGWSAQRLAEEMSNVGVPWNRHIVVNLEQGRRKSLRVHELLALAYVLDADSPADLMAPDDPKHPMMPVTPNTLLARAAVRAWCLGETGPLRDWLAQPREGEQEDLAELLQELPAWVRQQVVMLARSTVRAPRAGSGEPE